MKRIAVSALLILLSFCLLPELISAQQQGVPVDGKDFYIGFVYPSFNNNPGQQGRDFHGFFGVYALVSSYEDNNIVKFAYFDAGGNEVASVSKVIRARSAVQVPLDIASMKMSEPGDIPEYKACHITAKKPVNVQYFSTGACSGGSYLAIPTPALGKSYVVPSFNDNPDQGAGLSQQQEPAAGFFLIVAAFDGTNITITPNSTTAGGHTGVNCGNGANGTLRPYTISLRRGQCYWVKGQGKDGDCDMSGSLVVSDKPIAVLGGHENAFLGDVGSRTLEGRDFMIEEVIPSEYWDSTGYVSIPMKDGAGTQAGDAGYGENYRVYTNDIKGAAVKMSDCNVALKAMDDGRLAYPTPENNTGCAAEFHTTDGHKFGVMMYDLRDQGNAAPHAAESMMSIVPMSRWRTSFLFYVPANTFEVLQNYYINIIGLKRDFAAGNIKYSLNGSTTLNRLTGLSAQGSYKQIPFHPELEGNRFSVAPGAYYFTNIRTKIDTLVPIDTMLQGAFMMYHYGMRAIDPDRDLGDFCGDDFFFSYALPIGMTVSSGGGDPRAKVDTLCSSWHVCVRDTGGVTIRSVTLLDDPDGNYYRPGKQFFNAHFDPALDPDNKGEIDFTGDDTSVCFDVIVSNPLDSAYAPLYIVDSRGAHVVIDLRYKAPKFTLTKLPDFPPRIDTLAFPPTKIGDEVCSTLVYINTAPKGGKAFNVISATLKKNDPHFKISSITPSLPVSLKGGDSLKVLVCFDPKDTTASNDSVILTTDCFAAPLPIIGKGGTPLIYATDIDFGSVPTNTTLCLPLVVENRGTLPFLLTKNYFLHDKILFSIDPASAARLPVTLQPGGSITLTFCYSPKVLSDLDSTSVDWITDIPAPFTQTIKSWSYLRAKPIKPGVTWDRFKQLDSVVCEDSVVRRVYLLNNSSQNTTVADVYFDGPNASEYHILGNKLGRNPLANFNLNIKDTIWVDIVFKADLSKGYADRKARIIATYATSDPLKNDSTVIDLTGKVQHAVLVSNPALLEFGFVTRGTSSSKFVTIINTGDAPYIISNLDLPNPPIDSILRNGILVSVGDVIGVGDTVTFQIHAHLDTYTDTTVTYHLNSTKSLCSNHTAQIHIAAASLKTTATSFPAPNTFVGCREYDSVMVATNLGSVSVTLLSVDIISTPGTPNPGEFDLVDAGNNHVKTVIVNKLLKHLDQVRIPIIYHPTIAGPVSATIVYHWDSAGVKFDSTRIASGIGRQLKTTVSAAQVGGAPFSAPTSGSFTLPISLVNTSIPDTADVHRITFRLTYRRDVLNLTSATPPASGKFTVANSQPTQLANIPTNGDESIDLDVSSSSAAPITSLEDIINVNYQVMVSKEVITPFIVSNVTFYDSKGNSICYVAADTIPGAFVPNYICADTSLNLYLKGVLPTRINMLSPNIVGENQSPVLYYSINRSDIPVKVEIFNVLGERVRTIKNTASQAVGSYQLPIGTKGMQSGTYLVRLTTPVSSQTVNFIMQK